MNKMEYTIKGDFTSVRALEIKNELLDISRNHDIHLMLDISEAQAADIGALNAIMMCHNTLRKNNGQLTIYVKKDNPLHELFHLTKFDKFLDVRLLN